MRDKRTFLELSCSEQLVRMEKWRDQPGGAKSPSSETLIKRMTTIAPPSTSEEAEHDHDVITAKDYDEWVYQLFFDLCNGRIQAGSDGKVEHPKDRLFRIGEQSISDRQPSELFLYLKELISQGMVLPNVTPRKLKAAQKRLDIANLYKIHLTAYIEKPSLVYPKNATEGDKRTIKISLQEAKAKFKMTFTEYSPDAIDDALAAHHLNWSAYSVDTPRKGKRKKTT